MRALAGLLLAAALQALFLTSLHGGAAGEIAQFEASLEGSLLLALGVLLVVGGPIYLLLQKFRKAGFVVYAASGWCVGVSPWLLARALEAARMGLAPWYAVVVRTGAPFFELRDYLIWGASGVLAALVFWMVVRPDVRSIQL